MLCRIEVFEGSQIFSKNEKFGRTMIIIIIFLLLLQHFLRLFLLLSFWLVL